MYSGFTKPLPVSHKDQVRCHDRSKIHDAERFNALMHEALTGILRLLCNVTAWYDLRCSALAGRAKIRETSEPKVIDLIWYSHDLTLADGLGQVAGRA